MSDARNFIPGTFWTFRMQTDYGVLMGQFKETWGEYIRLSDSFGQYARDVGNARLFKARMISAGKNPLGLLTLKTDFGEFYGAGEEFLKKVEEVDKAGGRDARAYVQPCLKALTCFVKFLTWEKGARFKGLDDSVRDIYNNRNLTFKISWTRVLRKMAEWVRVVYPDDVTWNKYLETSKEKVNWPEILQKLAPAEQEVKAERGRVIAEGEQKEIKRQAERDRLQAVKAAPVSAKTSAPVSAKTKRGRGMFSRHIKSELAEPHALARMRGLLGEI